MNLLDIKNNGVPCLARWRSHFDNKLVATAYNKDDAYMCWVFPAHSPSAQIKEDPDFYFIDATSLKKVRKSK